MYVLGIEEVAQCQQLLDKTNEKIVLLNMPYEEVWSNIIVTSTLGYVIVKLKEPLQCPCGLPILRVAISKKFTDEIVLCLYTSKKFISENKDSFFCTTQGHFCHSFSWCEN